MKTGQYVLVLKNASLVDADEISEKALSGEVEVVEPSEEDGHGELATIILVALAGSALTAFTLWLLKDRDSETIDYSTTVRKPDGSETIVALKVKRSSSKAPEAQVIEQIADALKVPKEAILAA